ncbi:hypothetical protein PDE_01906 [Penicillium oxalicum 114-2]|uniref:Uncharacterized protein n=1 Tax=Penicillium oxalicum (strain 114-2 / CGMCC 5302) TaxID=933388 RepID=S7ZE48_PENO1|nr:hypothetical protein PDE_01906 [Penicillium oxalicum 114-2]
MPSILLYILIFVPCVLADDWEDFTNNLATDLAPLITLFGERLTKQFLSESISLLDNFIFALSPLGVLTAVVSVIRVCGGSSLRAFIGRAQEGPAEAEAELLPCVSESTAELFNEGGISRVFGRPKIVEIVMWNDDEAQNEEDRIKIGTLRDALQCGAWSARDSALSLEDLKAVVNTPELDVPNLSLNKGIKCRGQFWFYCVAIIGVLLQLGSMVYAGITVFVFPSTFEKDGSAVPSYAFPFYILGSVLLFIGMLFCAIIIERSSDEIYFKPNKPSKIFWLQPGKQNVGDQVFNAFLAVKEGSKGTLTKKMEYIKSVRVRKYDGRSMEIYVSVLSTLLGFIFQFIGLRGLHASVILAQLGSTFIMSILRTCLRTERMPHDENRIRDERGIISNKHQELDCLTFHLHGIESLEMLTPSTSSQLSTDLSSNSTHSGTNSVKQIVRTRTRLAELTSMSNQGLIVDWNKMPIRDAAQSLVRAIESTTNLLSGWSDAFTKSFEFNIQIECQRASNGSFPRIREMIPLAMTRCGDSQRWTINVNQLEAMIGLSVWSLYKSEEQNLHRPLSRMIGLSTSQASQKETYRLFHRWVYRQTDARLTSAKMADHSRRWFGWFTLDSEENNLAEEVFVMRTKNEIEKMVAQDIFVQYLLTALGKVPELGGDTKIIHLDGSYDSFTVHNNRVDEMVRCFEDCGLGSREDALLCITLVLKERDLLPELLADAPNVRNHVEKLVGRNDWHNAFDLVWWICQRSDGVEFETSAYELGYLCRRALLNPSKSAQEEGLENVCRMLKFDIGANFRDIQRMRRPVGWPISSAAFTWWTRLSRQVAWVAWHISINAKGMDWVQQPLREIWVQGQPGNLPIESAAHTEMTSQESSKILRNWLVLDLTAFIDEHSGEQDLLAFRCALETGNHALIYFTMVVWTELGLVYPGLVQHAFLVAARSRCEWAIQVLLKRGADIESTNSDQVSALAEAVILDDVDATRMLLEHGASSNGHDQNPKRRPLLLAAQRGATEIARLILEHGANLEAVDRVGLTALHWAVRENQVETTQFLLARGADFNQKGPDQLRPLDVAVMNDQVQMVDVLLQNSTSNINDCNWSSGRTALITAVTNSKIELVNLLLSKGADPQACDDNGLTPIDWAKSTGKDDVLSILQNLTGHKPDPAQGRVEMGSNEARRPRASRAASDIANCDDSVTHDPHQFP